jgi:hypothetical protein
MKNGLLTFAILFALSAQTFSQCIADWGNVYDFSFDGRSYKVVKEKKNWATAAACAVELGGYLVEINSQEEQDAVFDAILNGAQVSATYTSVGNGGSIAYVWIGANDLALEGTWVWNGNNDSESTPFWAGTWPNWGPIDERFYNWGGKSTGVCKEPDNYNNLQHCAGIGLRGWPSGTTTLGIPGEWNDIYCSSQLYFVIEFDSLLSVSSMRAENIEIFPNPARNTITFKGFETYIGKNLSVRIYNLVGVKIMDQLLVNQTVDVSHINHYGLLFVDVVDNEGVSVYTTKIVKQ